MADQRAASPMHAKMTEHPMFDLVPFASTWGEMADRHAQANVIGQLLQGYLPQAVPAPIAAPAVGRNQQGMCARVALRSHVLPPSPEALHGKGGRVVIDPNIDPPHIGCLVIHAVRDGFPQVLVDEIVDANPFWLAVWTPFLASI